MEVDVGGLVVSQYSLLGAHDPAWLTLLPLSSGATIHHDTGVGGRAKIQPAGAIHRDTAQWEIVRHNTVVWAKRGMAVAGPRMEVASEPSLLPHLLLPLIRLTSTTYLVQVHVKYTFPSLLLTKSNMCQDDLI